MNNLHDKWDDLGGRVKKEVDKINELDRKIKSSCKKIYKILKSSVDEYRELDRRFYSIINQRFDSPENIVVDRSRDIDFIEIDLIKRTHRILLKSFRKYLHEKIIDLDSFLRETSRSEEISQFIRSNIEDQILER